MKKYLCVFCTAIFFIFLPLAVHAEIPRVIFTNKPTEDTCLYVSKKVLSSVSGIPVPEDASFSFSLKLDHAAARDLTYRLYGTDGKELFNYNGTLTTEKDPHQIAIPFKTDRSGIFQLKASQAACFENLKKGSYYEVSEEKQPGYIQTEPAGETDAVGNIAPGGNAAVFQNLYLPEIPAAKETTTLEIRKDIAFPTGYRAPPSPDFSFVIVIRGKAWANEMYTVIDTHTGKTVAEGKTDKNGCFSMKGGCTARFENIPCAADYLVTEKENENWRTVSCFNTRGATKIPLTSVGFTNTQASFAVTKEMEEHVIVDTPFIFQLKRDGLVWPDTEYYLYETSGKRVDDEIHLTDTDGTFTLFPDQTAVFINVPPGTAYSVSETADENHLQLVPPSAEGYSNKTVSDSMEILPFVNQYHADADAGLLLRLIKKGEEGTLLRGAAFKLFSDKALSEEICEVTTGKDGIADFGEIEPGIYYLKESIAPAGYRLLSNPLELEIEEEQLLINGHPYQASEETENVFFKDTADGTAVYITIFNHRNFNLPLTGGKGITVLLLCSASGILILIAIMTAKKNPFLHS